MVRPATDAAQKAQAKAKRTSKTLQTVSPAEFFATNREIAGFDNVRSCNRNQGGGGVCMCV